MNIHRCFECSSEFDWDFQLEHHTKTHRVLPRIFLEPEPEQHSCEQCLHLTHNKVAAYEHYNYAHKSGSLLSSSVYNRIENFPRYVCEVCQFNAYTSLAYVKLHDCKEKFQINSEKLDYGMIGGEGKGLNVCAHCSYQSADAVRFERHSLQHIIAASIAWFNCDKCPYKALTKADLKQHQNQKHQLKGKFDCSKCPYRTKSKRTMTRHRKLCGTEADGIDWLYCGKCSYRTSRKEHLKRHQLRHDALTNTSAAWFTCDKCLYQTGYKKNLDRHKLQHQIVWFECTHCSYKGKSNARFKRHVLARHTETMFNCTKCSYKSNQKSNFDRHLWEHATPKDIVWYNCAVCAYQTKYKNNLKSHMVRHAKPGEVEMHKCEKCPFQTKRKIALKKHMVTKHSKE